MIGTITTANATEFQNNIGEYLNMVANGEEVVVTRDGEMLGRFVPKDKAITFLANHLSGILKGDANVDAALDEADFAAAADSRRLTHEEVFGGLRRRLNA